MKKFTVLMLLVLLIFIVTLFSCSSFPLMTKKEHKEEMSKMGATVGILYSNIKVYDKELSRSVIYLKACNSLIEKQHKRILQYEEERKFIKEQIMRIVKVLRGQIDDKNIQISKLKDRVIVTIENKILFDTGKTEIKEEALNSLRKISNVLAKYNNNLVYIEGNTDSVPIRTKRFRNNWQLSTERSLKVLDFLLQNKKLDPKKIIVTGRSKFNPVSKNKNENRRVDIIIVLQIQE